MGKGQKGKELRGKDGLKGKEDLKGKDDRCGEAHVLPFYSDRVGKEYREFSNFFSEMPPYEFTLPDYATSDECPRTVTVQFSEKAIMLVKAALFKDVAKFKAILHADTPMNAKQLGRQVSNFDADVWETHLEETAFECVRQKFESSPRLRKVLLQTGDKILCEAAPNDRIWGIGLATSDERAYYPHKWQGRNILGHALMRTRSHLRGESEAPAADASCSAEPLQPERKGRRWSRPADGSKEGSGYVPASMMPPEDPASGDEAEGSTEVKRT